MPLKRARRKAGLCLGHPPTTSTPDQHKIVWMATSQATLLEVVRVPDWADLSWLIHGFSTRLGGRTTVYRPGKSDLNLGFTDSDDRDVVAANRGLFVTAATAGREILGLVSLRQIHSSLIHRVSA